MLIGLSQKNRKIAYGLADCKKCFSHVQACDETTKNFTYH